MSKADLSNPVKFYFGLNPILVICKRYKHNELKIIGGGFYFPILVICNPINKVFHFVMKREIYTNFLFLFVFQSQLLLLHNFQEQ